MGKSSKVENISVLGKKFPVPNKKDLEKKLVELEEKYGGNLVSKSGNLRIQFLHKEEPDFVHALGLYNKNERGVFLASAALEDFGFSSINYMSKKEAFDIVLDAVSEKNLSHLNESTWLEPFLRSFSAESEKAYLVLRSNPRNNKSRDLLWDFIKEHRPDALNHIKKKSRPKYSDKFLSDHYTSRFVSERPVLLRSENIPSSMKIDDHVRRKNLTGTFELNNSFGSDSVFRASSKVVHYLRKNPHFANIEELDIVRNFSEYNKIPGTIAELEGEILFLAYQKNPKLFSDYSFDFLEGKTLEKVISTRTRHLVTLEQRGPKRREADIRLVMNNDGKEEHILIDVKSYSDVRNRDLKKMIAYKDYEYWDDGTPISKKIMIFNSLTYNFKEVKHTLESHGLSVISSQEFDSMYKSFLSTLSMDFNLKAEVPLAGTQKEVRSKLFRVHDLISRKSSFFAQYNNSYLMNYVHHLTVSLRDYFVKENSPKKSVESNIILKDRKKFLNMPLEKIISLRDVFKDYGRNVDMNYVASIMKNNLYLDLETSGLGRSFPIYLTGLSYVHEKKGPIVHILIARDPLEEKQMLKKYASIADHLYKRAISSTKSQFSFPEFSDVFKSSSLSSSQYDFTGDGMVLDFNGLSFDQKVLHKRFMANRLPYTIQNIHGDLMYPWKIIGKFLPNQKLQMLEQVFLDTHVRTKDVRGEEIPQIYYDGIRGASPDRLYSVIEHNSPDLATSVLLHVALQNIPLFGKPLSSDLIESVRGSIERGVSDYDGPDFSDVPF